MHKHFLYMLIIALIAATIGCAPKAMKSADDDPGRAMLGAAEAGDAAEVERLLHSGADPNLNDKLGWTPLAIATNKDHPEVVKLLLDHGADVAYRDILGRQPLANVRSKEVAKMLLDRGADVNAKDNDGTTALILSSFLDPDLHGPSADQAEAIIELLVENGADVTAADRNGVTSLMGAAFTGHVRSVKMMLNRGAQVNAFTTDGESPLSAAGRGGHEEIARKLLERGADCNAATSFLRKQLPDLREELENERNPVLKNFNAVRIAEIETGIKLLDTLNSAK